MKRPNTIHLATAIATAISLSACGSGGGGTKSDPAPPITPPTPTTCQDSTATNHGGALPCTYRYNGEADNLRVPTNVDQAHAAGITGKGAKVGLLDDAKHDYAPLNGTNIASYVDYTGQTTASKNKPWHGVEMAAVIAGQATGTFKGGVAPDAALYWARVCNDNGCSGSVIRNAVSDMVDAGVRIFNVSNSIADSDRIIEGSEHPHVGYNTADSWRSVYNKALQAGSLIVASAGNESAATAGVPAAIPKYFPELSGQFIAVTGIEVDAKGNPTGLANITMDNGQPGTLNACGDAAQWCVAGVAPILLPGEGNIPGGGRSGTSTTAAEVTGVAALVSQAFPWMTGSNLQTTILTTATDIGEAGVDRIYGWGLVNAGKAINGPGQFVNNFTANVTTANGGTFANAISGQGGLTKTGAGTLTLAGNNTYTGLTSVQAGTLALSGGIAGNVNVDKGTFASYGGKIGGNYTATANGTTAIQVGTGLTVAGTATLNGTQQLLAPASSYTVGNSEKIIGAGKVDGTFAKITYGNEFFWSASLDYAADSVTAKLTRNSSTVSAMALSMTPAVIEGAKHADVLIGALDKQAIDGQPLAAVSTSVAGLMAVNTPAAAAALESLSGQVYGTAQALAFAQGDADSRVLADRLAGLSGGDRGVWVQTYGLDGTLDHDGFASADMHLFGGMAGADARVGEHATLGAALATSRLRGHIDGLNGSTEGRADTLALYGRADAGNAYLSGFIGYSNLSQDVERTVAYGTGSEQLAAKVDGNAWQARIEAGYTLSGDLTPFVAVGHTRLHRDGFSEHSTSGLGLAAGSNTARITTGELGLRWNTELARGSIGTDLALRHRFGDRTPSFVAAFDGLQSAAFDVAGTPLSTNDVRVGLMGTYRLTPAAQLFGNVSALWDNANGHNVTGTVGLRVGF